MCTKRVFSRDNYNINYKDYYTLKNGNEVLKTLKSEDTNTVINKFTNYNSWQTLSASYFKNLDEPIEFSYVNFLYNSNESFIDKTFEELVINETNCSSEKNVLYPYGKIISKKEAVPFFPSNIYLCKWCNKNKNLPVFNLALQNNINKKKYTKNTTTCDCECKKKIQYECECKNTPCDCKCQKYKNLFI